MLAARGLCGTGGSEPPCKDSGRVQVLRWVWSRAVAGTPVLPRGIRGGVQPPSSGCTTSSPASPESSFGGASSARSLTRRTT